MAEQQTFASLGKMEAIRQLFEGSGYKPFEEPLHFVPAAKSAVCTASRCFLEGVDFNLVYFPLKHLYFVNHVHKFLNKDFTFLLQKFIAVLRD